MGRVQRGIGRLPQCKLQGLAGKLGARRERRKQLVLLCNSFNRVHVAKYVCLTFLHFPKLFFALWVRWNITKTGRNWGSAQKKTGAADEFWAQALLSSHPPITTTYLALATNWMTTQCISCQVWVTLTESTNWMHVKTNRTAFTRVIHANKNAIQGICMDITHIWRLQFNCIFSVRT